MSLVAINLGYSSTSLTHEGKPESAIILAKDAMPYTTKAADKLSDYLGRITGASINIVHSPENVPPQHTRIWVGDHPDLRKSVAGFDPDLNRPETIHIQVEANDLILIGTDQMEGDFQTQAGTYLAVLTFLQDTLGVRWLWPGELGTDVPRHPTLTIEPSSYTYTPQLKYRVLRGANYKRYWDGLRQKVGLPEVDHTGRWLNARDEQIREWLNNHKTDQPPSGASRSPLSGSLPFAGGHAFSNWYDCNRAKCLKWVTQKREKGKNKSSDK